MKTVKAYPEDDGLWSIVAPLKIWQRKGYFMNTDAGQDHLVRLLVWPQEVLPIWGALEQAARGA